MDAAANSALDEPSHKFGGDANETPPAQGKGNSSEGTDQGASQDMRMLSAKARKRLDTLSTLARKKAD